MLDKCIIWWYYLRGTYEKISSLIHFSFGFVVAVNFCLIRLWWCCSYFSYISFRKKKFVLSTSAFLFFWMWLSTVSGFSFSVNGRVHAKLHHKLASCKNLLSVSTCLYDHHERNVIRIYIVLCCTLASAKMYKTKKKKRNVRRKLKPNEKNCEYILKTSKHKKEEKKKMKKNEWNRLYRAWRVMTYEINFRIMITFTVATHSPHSYPIFSLIIIIISSLVVLFFPVFLFFVL